jgi:disulfide bond formation protein DsbB
MLERFPASRLYLLSVALVVAAIGGALYLQYAVGLLPCPLCVMQRVGLISAALFALLAVVVGRSIVRPIFGSVALVCALAGGAVSVWHAWLLAHPPETLGCGRPFEWFSDDFPLVVWLPKLFRGDGDCLDVSWSIFGLGVPHLAGLVYIVLIALLILATVAAFRERRARQERQRG